MYPTAEAIGKVRLKPAPRNYIPSDHQLKLVAKESVFSD
jgi:hypothetical protein